MNIDDFLQLSEALTGISPLPADLAAQYLARLTNPPDGGDFDRLGSTFKTIQNVAGGDPTKLESGVSAQIMGDATLAGVAAQVIYIWYLSAIRGAHPKVPTLKVWKYGSPEQYDSALVWSVLNGHAPMTPGTYGFWATKP
jgi:hypothetical protein